MQKILLQYHNEGDAQVIKNYLETRLPFEIFTSAGPKETEGYINGRTIHLLIYETDQYLAKDFHFIRDLRGIGFAYPVLILGKTIAPSQVITIAEKLRIHFMEKPFEFKALRGLTRKLLTQKSVSQQIHRRFRTNQDTKLETYMTGQAIESRMYNLSVGGAYFEFHKKQDLVVGDLLKMKISLNDMQREHAVNARVVWTVRRGLIDGKPGCGVRFVKGQELYRQLVEKV